MLSVWLITVILTLITWANVVFPRFLHCEVTFLLLPYPAFRKELGWGEWAVEGESICINLGVPYRRFFSPIQSFIYIGIFTSYFAYFMDIYFILWGFAIYFLAQSDPALAIGSSLRLAPVLCLVDMSHLFFFKPFLFGTVRCSWLLYVPCTSHRISHFSNKSGFIFWRMVLETKIQVLGVHVATGVCVTVSRPSQLIKLGSIFMRISSCIYTCL